MLRLLMSLGRRLLGRPAECRCRDGDHVVIAAERVQTDPTAPATWIAWRGRLGEPRASWQRLGGYWTLAELRVVHRSARVIEPGRATMGGLED